MRYAVTLDGDGFGIWELCDQCFEFGSCRFELWCACLLLDGGPCRSRHSVHSDLGVALALAESLEAEAVV